MLFSYSYVKHDMEKMQKYIDYIFYQVWCKSKGKNYNIEEVFSNNQELKQLIIELGDFEGASSFVLGIQEIFEDFKNLSYGNIKQLKHWYKSNNNIELVCANHPSVSAATYQVIASLNEDLADHLKSFFKCLYSQGFLSLKSVSSRIGEIDVHYRNFMGMNRNGKCPFCGISDILGVYHTKRDAYDHYLPKDKYPFNTINFRNLAPACPHCNSTYKLANDPLFSPKDPLVRQVGARRKAFYPFSNASYTIEISIDIRNPDIDRLSSNDIQFGFGPPMLNEEIETWKDVYGIEERYRAKLLDGDGKAWLVEILDEWKWKEESAGEIGRTPHEYLRDINRHTNKSPYAGANFLKMAYLEGCQRVGLFNAM